MKKIALLLLVLLSITLFVVGCGSNKNVNEDGSQLSKATQSTTEKTKLPENYTVVFNSNGGDSISNLIQAENTSVLEPTQPTKTGFEFEGWYSDATFQNKVSWPLKLTKNVVLYAKWKENISVSSKVKEILSVLTDALNQDPYSYIPETMRPTYQQNLVNIADIPTDYTNFVNVSSIPVGFGEQWNMVLDNINQSKKFYNALTIGDNLFSASMAIYNTWFNDNPNSTEKELTETKFNSKVTYKNGVLSYILEYKTDASTSFFGSVKPKLELIYDIANSIKTVKISLTDTNELKYIISNNKYEFAIEYG